MCALVRTVSVFVSILYLPYSDGQMVLPFKCNVDTCKLRRKVVECDRAVNHSLNLTLLQNIYQANEMDVKLFTEIDDVRTDNLSFAFCKVFYSTTSYSTMDKCENIAVILFRGGDCRNGLHCT